MIVYIIKHNIKTIHHYKYWNTKNILWYIYIIIEIIIVISFLL